LRQRGQSFPNEGGAQDIVALDKLLHGIEEAVQQLPIRKRDHGPQQIRIIILPSQPMMEQNAFLQRRQSIDILDIRDAAGRLLHDLVDILLI
jgi:hypothetical protein